MKLMHLSDLHLGKRLLDVNIYDDQAHILKQIVSIAEAERPEAVLIAGDVYDRGNPSSEAMDLFSAFLRDLSALKCRVMVIAGNHDSALRVAYLRELVSEMGVYISPVYDNNVQPVTLKDEYGPVNFYLLPFIHPEQAKSIFKEADISNANDALRAVLEQIHPDTAIRNVILSHQFIEKSAVDDRDQRSVGTLDSVDPALYADYDYVALGHIHRAQSVGRADGTMRYCGTPLKYSKKEVLTDKTVTMVNLGNKGDIQIKEIPLKPLHEVRLIEGFFDDIMSDGPAPGTEEDFFYITLKDETDIASAGARLRERFGNVLTLEYDNSRTRAVGAVINDVTVEEKTPLQLIEELYRTTHGNQDMSPEALAFVQSVMREMDFE